MSKQLTKGGRGSFDGVVKHDKSVAVVKWQGSKPIQFTAAKSAVEPLETCQRCSKNYQLYIEIPQKHLEFKKYLATHSTYSSQMPLVEACSSPLLRIPEIVLL